jgi:hypothetical protein
MEIREILIFTSEASQDLIGLIKNPWYCLHEYSVQNAGIVCCIKLAMLESWRYTDFRHVQYILHMEKKTIEIQCRFDRTHYGIITSLIERHLVGCKNIHRCIFYTLLLIPTTLHMCFLTFPISHLAPRLSTPTSRRLFLTRWS